MKRKTPRKKQFISVQLHVVLSNVTKPRAPPPDASHEAWDAALGPAGLCCVRHRPHAVALSVIGATVTVSLCWFPSHAYFTH